MNNRKINLKDNNLMRIEKYDKEKQGIKNFMLEQQLLIM